MHFMAHFFFIVFHFFKIIFYSYIKSLWFTLLFQNIPLLASDLDAPSLENKQASEW